MALTSSALKKIAGSGDQNLYVYKSADAVSTIVKNENLDFGFYYSF